MGQNIVEALNALGKNVTTLFTQVGGLSEQTTGELSDTLTGFSVLGRLKGTEDFSSGHTDLQHTLNISEIGSSLRLNITPPSNQMSYDPNMGGSLGSISAYSTQTYEFKVPAQEYTYRKTNDIHLPLNTDTIFINGTISFLMGERRTSNAGGLSKVQIPIKIKIQYIEPNYIFTILESEIIEKEYSSPVGGAISMYIWSGNTSRYIDGGISFINSETFKGYTG